MSKYEILTRDEMSPRQRQVADAIAAGPRGSIKGPFIALIHNPELANHLQALGEHLRFRTGLPGHLVEIAVLITAHRWSSDYEWLAHARIGREAGLSDEVITSLGTGRRPDPLDSDASLIYDFAYETAWQGRPSDSAFSALKSRFGSATSLDVLAVCGYYTTLAFILNAAELPLPSGKLPAGWGQKAASVE
ncbi:carboxymuconolactone decarboxylase family protein (plasmid) [Caballeronia sp. NK8]|uniref:carboxymuconolactone decarboxylase family protein n=1 Tax=Caballeronia sp. NK8 TaxID=140098 RepID=UPI001BB4CBBC|nr:carboxymuconolactone decarboxylase family protein [Caballeronia sp. NK8]BCQ28195.1 carboxymuconolactone decarboxylase family protein [Caballeronia sp. NK8]